MIPRPYYLDLLNRYKDLPLVKILAGIRRSGKSTILEMFCENLIQSGISKDHIIQRRYTSEDFDNGMTDKEMYEVSNFNWTKSIFSNGK
ncbi:AAA family ATPase [Faecalicoccus acidiformans]|uniref:AAA family ATPase n=1 Tax=Faecalicoccus acidiformans TaxID=915173 RepID=UPI0025A42FB7|nr:AAA family ATPase [Faecalicoccus acidiformans]MDM8204413.1 AAA family ATPase [Faecalicoccus acidiformans]